MKQHKAEKQNFILVLEFQKLRYSHIELRGKDKRLGRKPLTLPSLLVQKSMLQVWAKGESEGKQLVQTLEVQLALARCQVGLWEQSRMGGTLLPW